MCMVGCATRGIATVEHFMPDMPAEAQKDLLTGAASASDAQPPLAAIDSSVFDEHALIQGSATNNIVEESLPTMD